MKCLIVDDEALARQRLARMLEDLEHVELCGQAANGQEALALVESAAPDTVLLDIRMPGMDGLEAARHLSGMKRSPAVIFTTAYGDHALEAFDAQAIDYLLKPIDRQRLQQALDKAQRLSSAQLESLGGASNDAPARTHLCARSRGSLQLIPVEEIIYLHADNKYVTVRSKSSEILIEESLRQLEQEFGDRFIRIHRNALIARSALRGLEKNNAGHTCAVLAGVEQRLEVSRRLVPAVRRQLKQGHP